MFFATIYSIIFIILGAAFLAAVVYLFILLVKALRRYINSREAVKESAAIKISLGEAIKAQRSRCKMTQEFVAESIGVSRQAVSKWESGASDPSTSNLFALAKLFGVTVEELLGDVK